MADAEVHRWDAFAFRGRNVGNEIDCEWLCFGPPRVHRDIRYRGIGATYEYRHNTLRVRLAAAGGGYEHKIRVSGGDEHEARSEGALGGFLLQGGKDWRYFGMLLGVGFSFRHGDDSQYGRSLDPPMLAPRFRIGPRYGAHLRLAAFDEVPVERGIASASLVYAQPTWDVSVNLRGYEQSDVASWGIGGRAPLTRYVQVTGRVEVRGLFADKIPQAQLGVALLR